MQSGEKKAHWMDWAADKYDTQLIEDIKALCQVLYMFLPLPVFWALFDQQGSRWVLQAGLMNGDAGRETMAGIQHFLKSDHCNRINEQTNVKQADVLYPDPG